MNAHNLHTKSAGSKHVETQTMKVYIIDFAFCYLLITVTYGMNRDIRALPGEIKGLYKYIFFLRLIFKGAGSLLSATRGTQWKSHVHPVCPVT